MKRFLVISLPFLLGFVLGLWLFRWKSFGITTRAWFEIRYRFGVSWDVRVDYDFDGRPDRTEYVKPRRNLRAYLFGFGPGGNPDFREIKWTLGLIKRIRIWFQEPSYHTNLVASVAFRRGPPVAVAGQADLCNLLVAQPLPPFWFLPSLEDLGCGELSPGWREETGCDSRTSSRGR